MFRVIIADDERKIREGLMNRGDWAAYDMEVCALAADGDELCEEIVRFRPHLVITDLKMPGKSGTELMQYLAQQYPEMVVLVVSGYDDFAYMKQAIRANVFDYLLKPVRGTALNEALAAAAEKLREAERLDRESRVLNRNREILTGGIFERWVAGGAVTREELLACMGVESLGQEPFRAILLHGTNLFAIAEESYTNDVQTLLYGICNIVQELLPAHYRVMRISGYQLAIVAWGQACREEIDRTLLQLKEQIQVYLRIRCRFGIGPCAAGINELSRSYQGAVRALWEGGIGEKRSLLYEEELVSRERKGLEEKLEQLRGSFVSGDPALAFQSVEEFFQWAAQPESSFRFLRQAEQSLLKLMDQLFAGSEKESEERKMLLETLSNDTDTWYLSRAVQRYLRQECLPQITGYDTSVEAQVKDYIDQCQVFDFDLNQLSMKFGISKAYLIRRFREKYQVAPYKYLTERKIKVAKQLLLEQKYSMVELAERLDFTDSSHFTKTFKKCTGILPTKYRESVQEKKNGQA